MGSGLARSRPSCSRAISPKALPRRDSGRWRLRTTYTGKLGASSISAKTRPSGRCARADKSSTKATATPVAATAQAANVAHVLHATIDLLDLLMQFARFGRGHQSPAAALEQRDAELQLEVAHQPADARLRDMEQPRGLRGGAGGHNGAEHLDLAQVHAAIIEPHNTKLFLRVQMVLD